ncbi:hypothetical protein CVT24_007247 [Panaeolus cyanescens]|uniref:Lysine-specific metallo-endopeptidase domain-containing protein n=1 Tax=Panaeolus cyanescens TaxID=181874 RepID=A0A409YWF8_9AGAR|nr:hypothetical protein CVT24_007247 [Panaeolus cyanescens]
MYHSENGLLYLYAFLILWAQCIVAVPVPGVTFRGDYSTLKTAISAKHRALLDDAFKEAAIQIGEMKAVIARAAVGNAQDRQKVHTVFGNQVDMEEMLGMVNFIASCTLHLENVNVDLGPGTLGEVRGGKTNIAKKLLDKKGGELWKHSATLIHEASHLRPGKRSHDYFEWKGEENKSGLEPVHRGPVCGYMDAQYWLVVKHLGPMAWIIADAWSVFGFYVVHGSLPEDIPRNEHWEANYDPGFPPPTHVQSTIPHPDSILFYEEKGGSSSGASSPHIPHAGPSTGHQANPSLPHQDAPPSVFQYQTGQGSHASPATQHAHYDHVPEEPYWEEGTQAGPSTEEYHEYYSPGHGVEYEGAYGESHAPPKKKKPQKPVKKSMMLELFTKGTPEGYSSSWKGKKKKH